MRMQTAKIKSITKLPGTHRVFDLSVPYKSNFFIEGTDGKHIITHNCDYITPEAQAALRNLMEEYSDTTKFILTANYKEKISAPIVSRSQVYELKAPSKKEVANYAIKILVNEKIEFDIKDVILVVNQFYPDIRYIIGALQRSVLNGKLVVENAILNSNNIQSQVLDLLKTNKPSDVKLTAIRQMLADNNVRDYTKLYSFLYENIDEYTPTGNVSKTIHALAEGQFRDTFVPDKELNFMSALYTILE